MIILPPIYSQLGVNLFVADYWGYGTSQCQPAFSNTITDAPIIIFKAFPGFLNESHYSDSIFVLGRSLGSISAIETAHRYQEQIKVLIIESGFASIVNLLSHLGFPTEYLMVKHMDFPSLAKIRAMTVPLLIIHGEYDSLVPSSEGKVLFTASAAKDKELVIIPQADRNDIM